MSKSGEYEIQGRVVGDLHQENIPCAVCQAYEGRMSLLMIPAQVKCPNSWTTEYVGYLLAGRKTNRRSEFIMCRQGIMAHKCHIRYYFTGHPIFKTCHIIITCLRLLSIQFMLLLTKFILLLSTPCHY